jgi:hypothetical protein
MFWLGMLLGLFAGTMLGFLAATLLGMLARGNYEEFENDLVPEGCRYDRRAVDYPERG